MIATPSNWGAATLPADLIKTRVGNVECAVSGKGPAILLLHGAMGGYDQSLLLGRAALGSSEFQLIAVSRPGYLGTFLGLGKTPEEQADLCATLLDALEVPAAAVIAISGGGQCALQFALRHPERCWALVMVSACSAPIDVKLPLRFYLMKWMARIPWLVAAMRKKAAANPAEVARRSIADAALLKRTLDDPEAGPLLLALQLSTLDRMAQRLPGTENDIRQSRMPFDYPLERISAPTLVVHGAADEAVPFAQAQSLARRVPFVEALFVEGGEHVSLFTHLHEVRSRVAPFLSLHAPSVKCSVATDTLGPGSLPSRKK
jgi:pimeloyl-ACP methyl ester carboxylesterase